MSLKWKSAIVTTPGFIERNSSWECSHRKYWIKIPFLTVKYLNICNNKSILLSCIPTYPAPPVTRIPVWFQQLTYYTTTYHLPSHGQTTNQQIIRFFRSKQTEWCFKLDQASWVIQPCHKRDSSRYRNIIIGIPCLVFKCIKCCLVWNNTTVNLMRIRN